VTGRSRALLLRERARNAATLVAEHAHRGERLLALRAFLGTAAYSWSYPEWWWRTLRAAAGSTLRNRHAGRVAQRS
jgi:hypothetical protein